MNAYTQFIRAPRYVKLLFAQQFFEGFVPIMALYAIMFDRVGHLNLQQIGILFSIWGFAYVAAELPTGILADMWSRRNVIMLGGLLRFIGFTIWIVWPTFPGYAIGFALWGMMLGCTSGSVAAYLESELKHDDKTKLFARYFGWSMSANSLGWLIGYVIAAALTLRHTNILIALSALSSLSFLIIGFTHERPYDHHSTYLQTLRAGVGEVLHSPKLLYVCLVSFSIMMTLGTLEELLPRIYASFGLNDTWVSIMGALALVVSVLLLARLETVIRLSFTKQMLIMAGATLVFIGGLVIGASIASLAILAFNLVFHLFRPVYMHYVQDIAVGKARATINSIPGLASGLLSAGAYTIIGIVAQHTSQNFSFGIYAAVWAAVFVALAVFGRHYAAPKLADK
jgi:predicted MFS family arabinose efflux permease